MNLEIKKLLQKLKNHIFLNKTEKSTSRIDGIFIAEYLFSECFPIESKTLRILPEILMCNLFCEIRKQRFTLDKSHF